MISLKNFMEVVDYKITEGSEFLWSCYGPNAYRLDAWSGEHDTGYSCSIIFDTKNQTVYEVETHDYSNRRSYRLMNSEYKDSHDNEAASRDTDSKIAYDDVEFVDLELDEDWIEKTRAIVSEKEYDTRVQIPIDIPDEEMFELMKNAHKRDMTLNDYITRVLQDYIDVRKNNE